MISESQKQAIRELRDKGYALVIFSPYELDGVSVKRLESLLAEDGNEHIEQLSKSEDESSSH